MEMDEAGAYIPRAKLVPVQVGDDQLFPADRYRAVVEEADPSNVFGIVSPKYEIIQNEDCLAKVEEAIRRNPDYGEFDRRIEYLDDGAKMQVKYRFPDIEIPIDGTKDPVNPQVVGKNSYDGLWNFNLLLGAFQLVCSNGLVVGKTIFSEKQTHLGYISMDTLVSRLDRALNDFSMQTEIWKKWADRILGYDEYATVVDGLSPEFVQKDLKAVAEDVDNCVDPDTLKLDPTQKVLTVWAFYSILTAYATHRVESARKRVALDAKIGKVFSGLA